MPTIYSDRAFQKHYAELNHQLAENPEALTVDEMIQDLREHLVPLSPENTIFRWTSRDRKGFEILCRCTSLFLDSHKISKEQSDEISNLLEQTAPRGLRSEHERQHLTRQLLINQELPSSARSDFQPLQAKLSKKIEMHQIAAKEKIPALRKLEKKVRRLQDAMVITGCIAGFAFIASSVTLVALIGAPAALPILGIIFGIGCVFGITSLVFVGLLQPKYHARDALENEVNEHARTTQRLLELHDLLEDNDQFIQFLHQIGDPLKLELIWDDNIQIDRLVELFNLENATRELSDRIANAETAFREQSSTTKSEELKKLNPLNRSIQINLEKIKELRETLKLPASDLEG